MARRRETRAGESLPIRIWGLDTRGKPFAQAAETSDITQLGARVSGVRCCLKSGDIIGVQQGKSKARFRVTWAGTAGTSDEGEMGIQCVEPTRFSWDEAKEEGATAGAAGRPALDRRTQRRFACEGGAEVRPAGSSHPMWATVADISSSGCYLETLSPLPAQTQLEMALTVEGIAFRARGWVRTTHPAVGMGVEFAGMTDGDREQLAQIVGALEARSALTGTPVGEPPGAPAAAVLGARLQTAISALQEMEAAVAAAEGTLDARLVRDLRHGAGHVGALLALVEQWLKANEERDPAAIQARREDEEVRFATELAADVGCDVSANDAEPATPGMVNLQRAVNELQDRLQEVIEPEEDAAAVGERAIATMH